MPSKSFILTLIAALILFAALGQAQTATTGQVAGEVTDPSGAVISGAKVVLTSDVGVRRETATTSAGRYVFPLVPSGIYKLEINAPGFAAPTLDNVVVRITEVTTLDIGLKVAAGKESVAVSATASLVQTENAGRGLVIEEGQIRQLPMPTRNFTQSRSDDGHDIVGAEFIGAGPRRCRALRQWPALPLERRGDQRRGCQFHRYWVAA